MAEKHHLVVDGSNLATEGRTSPSLEQLDQAVRAYADEFPGTEIVVVVDASFEHRIDQKERARLQDAELHGEVVSPPAGAIGRGDAFVLRIAERTGATVLSNDSFQEFHGQHPWLFDEGRLVGGKPVPGVGWIFTPRIPVRGPKSRQATGKAKRDGAVLAAPAKAAELAKAAKKMAARRAVKPDGTPPKVGDVWDRQRSPAATDGSTPAGKPTGGAKKTGAAKKAGATKKAAVEAAAVSEKAGATKTAKKAKAAAPVKATKATKVTKTAKKAKAAVPAKASKAVKAAKKAVEPAKAATTTKPAKKAKKAAEPTRVTKAAKGPERAKDSKKAKKTAEPAKAAKKTKKPKKAEATGEATAPAAVVAHRPVADVRLLEAIHDATAEALNPPVGEAEGTRSGGKKGKGGNKGQKRRRAAPPPAVNEPLAFINFVAAYPMGSEVEGEVASYTSHGAMIEVGLPDGGAVHCYVPLTGLGDPPPRKAREVLSRGQRQSFVLVGLDPPRRVAELALPGMSAAALARSGVSA